MPRHYPPELRRQTCERMLAGEAFKDLVIELGIAEVTLCRWRRQALIDAGERPGLKSYEADPLLAGRRRVKEPTRTPFQPGSTIWDEERVPRIRLHDTRHTAASLTLAAGVPVKVVQEMLGHAPDKLSGHLVPDHSKHGPLTQERNCLRGSARMFEPHALRADLGQQEGRSPW
jgi:transposase